MPERDAAAPHLGSETTGDQGWVLAVVAAAALLLLPGVFWGLPDGKFVVGALRILDGGVPYRDFWTMYAPGSFYLVAALFGVFGRELIVQGIAVVVLRALAAGVVFRISRRLGLAAAPSALLALLVAAMFWETSPELTSYPPALLLLLLAVERMLDYFDTASRGSLWAAGALCGLAAWFKHDIAAYVTLALAGSAVLSWFAAGERRPRGWLPPWVSVATLAVAATVLVSPVALFLGWTAGPWAWRDLIVFPATLFSKVRGEAYAPLLPDLGLFGAWLAEPARLDLAHTALTHLGTWIVCNLPQYVFLVAVWLLLTRRRRLASTTLAAGLLFAACVPFFWLAAHVQKNTHPYSMAVFCLLLGAIAWRSSAENGRRQRNARRTLVAMAAFYAVGLLMVPAIKAARVVLDWEGSRALGLQRTTGVRVSRANYETYRPIVEAIERRVPEEEPIYVGVSRHDAIVITDLRFYYLVRRPGSSRYEELHPGFADHPRVQREIIADLERRRVRCAIIWEFGWGDRLLDEILARRRAAVPELGATLLDEYVASSFEPVERRGEYELVCRDSGPSQEEKGRRTSVAGP